VKLMLVTRHRAEFAEDRYGQTQPTGEFTDLEQKAEWVGRVSSREITDNRQTLLDAARMSLPPTEEVAGDDEYTALGVRWRVTGFMRQRHPQNPDREWFVTVDLQRAE